MDEYDKKNVPKSIKVLSKTSVVDQNALIRDILRNTAVPVDGSNVGDLDLVDALDEVYYLNF